MTWLYPDMPFHKVVEMYGYPVVLKDVARWVYYACKGGNLAHLVDAPSSISDQLLDMSV